jgi:hypothetical protein
MSKAAKTKVGKNIYGAKYHKYKLKPPAPLEEIRLFEKEHGISFPEEYLYFLTQVGNGGTGPGNGFFDGYKSCFNPDAIKWIHTPSEQLENELTDEEWDSKYGNGFWNSLTEKEREDYWSKENDEDEPPRDSGSISLTATDTTYLAHLIFAGKNRGRIVYLDWDGDCPPIWPKSSFNFLDWCENWFKEIVDGYNVEPGSFMYHEIGTQEDLMHSFYNGKNEQYKREVLYSFAKFSLLNNSTIDFLKEQQKTYKETAQILKTHC